jgi:hypothetical protein
LLTRAGVDISESLELYPVYPELVEGLPFLQAVVGEPRKKERCFDKLSIGGIWVRNSG